MEIDFKKFQFERGKIYHGIYNEPKTKIDHEITFTVHEETMYYIDDIDKIFYLEDSPTLMDPPSWYFYTYGKGTKLYWNRIRSIGHLSLNDL